MKKWASMVVGVDGVGGGGVGGGGGRCGWVLQGEQSDSAIMT